MRTSSKPTKRLPFLNAAQGHHHRLEQAADLARRSKGAGHKDHKRRHHKGEQQHPQAHFEGEAYEKDVDLGNGPGDDPKRHVGQKRAPTTGSAMRSPSANMLRTVWSATAGTSGLITPLPTGTIWKLWISARKRL